MTREHKLALILGFSIVLVVGVLVSDHLSGASVATLEEFAETTIGANTEPLIAPGQALREEKPAPEPDRLAQSPTPSSQTDVVPNSSAPSFEQYAQRNEDSGFNALVDAVQRQLDRAVPAGAPIAGQLAPDNSPTPDVVPVTPAPTTTTQVAAVAYTVTEGDTLWSITGSHYGEPLLHERVRAFNRARIGESGELRIGATIYLPERSSLESLNLAQLAETGANPASVSAGASKPAPANQVATADDRTYTVQKGDTLGEISMRLLGTSKRWREIVDLNADRIDNPDRVPAGVVLRIPTR